MSIVALLALASVSPANPGVPAVTFAHPGVIELYCQQVSPAKPDPRVLAEIDARIGEFETAWAKDGPRLMAQTERVVGRPYQFQETLATLHGCPDLPTMGVPLLINVVRFTHAYVASSSTPSRVGVFGLRPPHGPRAERPMSEFVHDTWNEINRRYIRTIRRAAPGGTTPLLRKYAGESLITQRNLHVVAVDEVVSERLGLKTQFEQREALLKSRGAKDLARAYDIVQTEGAEKFVAELRP